MISKTPKPPYYAVIFTSIREDQDEGYSEMAEKMEALVKSQPGYLGHESARSGVGITVSYWKSLEDIKAWKRNQDHLAAQTQGRENWYQSYKVRICKVETDYDFGC
jgi:heme-degrading monooxygenase HmoA